MHGIVCFQFVMSLSVAKLLFYFKCLSVHFILIIRFIDFFLFYAVKERNSIKGSHFKIPENLILKGLLKSYICRVRLWSDDLI